MHNVCEEVFLTEQMKTNLKFALSKLSCNLTTYFQRVFEIPHVSTLSWLVCIYCNVITDLSLNLPASCKKIVMTLSKHHSKSEIGPFALRAVLGCGHDIFNQNTQFIGKTSRNSLYIIVINLEYF